MDFISKATENIRIPHFFRDAIFLGGGTVVASLTVLLFPSFLQKHGISVNDAKIFLEDLNFFAYFLILTVAYFIGRLNDILADFLYDSIKLVVNVLFFCNDKRYNYYIQFKHQVKNYINKGYKIGPEKKLTRENSNPIQMIVYLEKNKSVADNLERGILADILYSHFLVIIIIVSAVFSVYFLFLVIFIFFKKYQEDQKQKYIFREISRVIEYESTVGNQEINKELDILKATKNI